MTPPSCSDVNIFQPETIEAIKSSKLLDFTIPHAGIIITYDCQFLPEVKFMVQHKIPVYFFWGQHGITKRFDVRFELSIYTPTCSEINITFSQYDTAHAPTELEAIPGSSSPEIALPFPKQPPGSLQWPYEGPCNYLNRRVHVIADYYRCADSVEKDAFKKRAAAQVDFPLPG